MLLPLGPDGDYPVCRFAASHGAMCAANDCSRTAAAWAPDNDSRRSSRLINLELKRGGPRQMLAPGGGMSAGPGAASHPRALSRTNQRDRRSGIIIIHPLVGDMEITVKMIPMNA